MKVKPLIGDKVSKQGLFRLIVFSSAPLEMALKLQKNRPATGWLKSDRLQGVKNGAAQCGKVVFLGHLPHWAAG